ncbi:V-type ATPase subunit [Enterococcus sp. LJL99]
MKIPSYNQLNPLVRIKEMELLTEKQYEQLLTAKNGEALERVFRSTIYAPYLTDGFLNRFDNILGVERGRFYEWLYNLAPEAEIISIYTSRFTFHNLKVLTKAQVLQQNLDYLFVFDGCYSIETLKSAVQTKKSSELDPFLLDAIIEVFDYLKEATDYQAIDIIYDRLFLTYQRQLAEKLSYPEVLEEVQAFIDLTNISTMARGIRQKQHKSFLSTVLSSSGTIQKKELLNYSEQNLTQFSQYLLTTKYHSLIASILDTETQTVNLIEFEQKKDEYLAKKFEKYTVVAFGPLPLLALLHAKELEWKNLRLLLVGKRNNFPVEQLRERIR